MLIRPLTVFEYGNDNIFLLIPAFLNHCTFGGVLLLFFVFILRESAENLCGCLSEPLAPRVIKLFPLRALCSVFHFGEAIPERASGTYTSIGGHIINGYGPRPGPDTQDGVLCMLVFFRHFSVHCRRPR